MSTRVQLSRLLFSLDGPPNAFTQTCTFTSRPPPGKPAVESELFRLLAITFGAAVLADVSMVFGVLPFFFVNSLSERLAGLFAAAAAGMMAAASLVQLVGEGLDRAPGLQAWEVAAGLALGAVFYFLAARWVKSHEDFDVASLRKVGGARSILIVAAMTIHSLPEGVAIGVAFGSREEALGIAVVSALAVHNIPEGIAITLALRAAGVSTRACLGWALVTSIPQPLAAPFAAWLIWIFEPLLPAGMGLAAGAMIYLVVDDLLPDAFEKANATAVAAMFIAGIVAMILLGRAVGL